jgi:hypothetical protein
MAVLMNVLLERLKEGKLRGPRRAVRVSDEMAGDHVVVLPRRMTQEVMDVARMEEN